MRTLGDADCLVLWESGFRRHPLDRALLALAAACPESGYESLADWPIGRRNRSLLELHTRCFGRHLQMWTACAACGEKLEIELDARQFSSEDEPPKRAEASVSIGGRVFRLPNSRDLARIVGEVDAAAGARRLLAGCCVDGEPAVRWSEEDLTAVGDRLAAADPLAEIRLSFRCPTCEAEWDEPFDPTTLFWSEVQGRARQVMSEVHALASAYGWSEADILAMSANRRTVYLEMLQS